MHPRHFYPNAEQRFPALAQLPYLSPIKALLISGGICECFDAPERTRDDLFSNRCQLAILVLEGMNAIVSDDVCPDYAR